MFGSRIWTVGNSCDAEEGSITDRGICGDGQISDADGAGWLAVIAIPDAVSRRMKFLFSSSSTSTLFASSSLPPEQGGSNLELTGECIDRSAGEKKTPQADARSNC